VISNFYKIIVQYLFPIISIWYLGWLRDLYAIFWL